MPTLLFTSPVFYRRKFNRYESSTVFCRYSFLQLQNFIKIATLPLRRINANYESYVCFYLKAIWITSLCISLYHSSIAQSSAVIGNNSMHGRYEIDDTQGLTKYKNLLFFSASNETYGRELWRSDGTQAGTYILKDIAPGADSASPAKFIQVGDILYFIANVKYIKQSNYQETGSYEIWKTDGTSAGTVKAFDVQLGNWSWNSYPPPIILTKAANTLYYTSNNTHHNYTLNSTKGLAMDIRYPSSLNPSFTDVNGVLFFASATTNGAALCKSDGTQTGTGLVREFINSGNGDGIIAPSDLTNVNGTLYFIANENRPGGFPDDNRLWKSDGTSQGTVKVTSNKVLDYMDLSNVNGILYVHGAAGLWKSDGTENGTVEVAPGKLQHVYHLIGANGTLYLTANDDTHGDEVWKSDGTAAGTVLIKDIDPGLTFGTVFLQFAYANGTVFFNYDSSEHGDELWKTDGTAEGTVLVKDIFSGKNDEGNPNKAFPRNFIELNSILYFTAYDGNGLQLWKSDGTEAGTVNVFDVVGPPVTCSGTGSILREKWLNVSGSTISQIPLSTSPASSTQLTSFETTPNQGDNYGERIRGYLCAPYSGAYTFYLSGDDQCELYLSSDEDPAKKTKIAFINYFTGVREWSKYASQKSVAIHLVAGKKYYMEALHKESLYLDHLAVGWQTPAQPAITVIPGSSLSPFIAPCSNIALSSYVINPASGTTTTSTKLYLKTIPGASAYTLQVSTSADFTTNVIIKTTSSQLSTGTYYASFTELSLNQKYYVRVSTNLALCWGPVTSFTTASAAASAYVVNPSDGATTTSTNLYLNTVPSASSYTLQVSPSADFITNVITKTTTSQLSTGTYYASFPELSLGATYFVRVRTNLSEVWGRTTSFTMATAESFSFVTNPANGGTTSGINLYLNTVPSATSYTLQVSTSADFTTSVISKTTTSRLSTGTYYAPIPELLVNQKYYVRVRTNLSDTWGRTTSFTRVSPTARLGVEELETGQAFSLQVYPNPFEDKLTLATSQQGKLYISVVDNLGRTVHQTSTQAGNELNLAHLKTGVYMLKVAAQDGTTQVLRVVKQ
jgi:ELWxxDGT repeat protein